MNEELAQLDAQLRGLFVELKFDEVKDLLKEQPDASVKEICDCNWDVIKKYYDTKRFELLLGHLKYVAYTSFIIEYAYQEGLMDEEEFGNRMMVYNAIYELNNQSKEETKEEQ